VDSPEALAFLKEYVSVSLLHGLERDPLLAAASDVLAFILADGAPGRRIICCGVLRSASDADVAHSRSSFLICGRRRPRRLFSPNGIISLTETMPRSLVLTIVLIVLLLALFGAMPTWPYSSDWGYYPSGTLGLLLLVVIVLLLVRRPAARI
jgi:hypothetical protein